MSRKRKATRYKLPVTDETMLRKDELERLVRMAIRDCGGRAASRTIMLRIRRSGGPRVSLFEVLSVLREPAFELTDSGWRSRPPMLWHQGAV